MKFRYLYLVAAVAFLVGAVFEFRPTRNTKAAVLDLVAGCLFLLLAAGQRKSKP
jgi:drug/metabolite transporter (DMT)-like permease